MIGLVSLTDTCFRSVVKKTARDDRLTSLLDSFVSVYISDGDPN